MGSFCSPALVRPAGKSNCNIPGAHLPLVFARCGIPQLSVLRTLERNGDIPLKPAAQECFEATRPLPGTSCSAKYLRAHFDAVTEYSMLNVIWPSHSAGVPRARMQEQHSSNAF
jgi:hypothetical protein